MNNSTIRSTLGFNLTQNILGLGLFRQVQTISLDKPNIDVTHSTLMTMENMLFKHLE